MSTPFDTDSSGAAAQASKRQRAGTATTKDVPDLALSVPALEKDLDSAMEVEFESARDQVAILINEVVLRQSIDAEDFIHAWLSGVGEFVQKKLPLTNICVAQLLHASPDDEVEITRSVEKVFGTGVLPNVSRYGPEDHTYVLWGRASSDEQRAKRLPKLLTDHKSTLWRHVKGRSFAMFGSGVALWPPSLSLGPGGSDSTLWCFDVKESSSEELVIGSLKDALGHSFYGYFARAVRYTLGPQ